LVENELAKKKVTSQRDLKGGHQNERKVKETRHTHDSGGHEIRKNKQKKFHSQKKEKRSVVGSFKTKREMNFQKWAKN